MYNILRDLLWTFFKMKTRLPHKCKGDVFVILTTACCVIVMETVTYLIIYIVFLWNLSVFVKPPSECVSIRPSVLPRIVFGILLGILSSFLNENGYYLYEIGFICWFICLFVVALPKYLLYRNIKCSRFKNNNKATNYIKLGNEVS